MTEKITQIKKFILLRINSKFGVQEVIHLIMNRSVPLILPNDNFKLMSDHLAYPPLMQFLILLLLAKLITDEQHEVLKKQRRLEVQKQLEIYQWGDDPNFSGFPGFIKSEKTTTLPKDVQFTEEDAEDLQNANNKALANLGLVKLLNIFDSWEDFDDYRKVCICNIILNLILTFEYIEDFP